MGKKEKILTKNEINLINSFVNNNPSMTNQDAIGIGQEKISVWKITPKNGIIIIKGDEYTGFEHINNRHNYWINNPYWENGKLENPSKFSRKSTPIMDYSNISDALYSESNLNSEKNNRPDLFDLYIGEIDDKTNGKMRYRMILYKDTKILHALFPEKKDNNRQKKNIINLYRGDTVGKLEDGQYIIETPWINENEQNIYNLVVYINLSEKTETCVLINLKENLAMILFEDEDRKEEILPLVNEINRIAFSDFKPIEKKIKEFENKLRK